MQWTIQFLGRLPIPASHTFHRRAKNAPSLSSIKRYLDQLAEVGSMAKGGCSYFPVPEARPYIPHDPLPLKNRVAILGEPGDAYREWIRHAQIYTPDLESYERP